MVPSSLDHRGRRLRTHMAARALQNLGLDSTGCGGGTRGLNYSPRDTIYRAPTTPLVRSMSSWESLLFLLPGGIECQDATRQRDAVSLTGTRCEERGPGPGNPLPGSIRTHTPCTRRPSQRHGDGQIDSRWDEPSSSSCSGRVQGTMSRPDKRNK